MSERCSRVIGAIRQTIEAELGLLRRASSGPLDLCDVGCWDGEPTAAYRAILGGSAAGVEVFSEQAAAARARNVDVAEIDLETQRFPWPAGSFDVVVANQVFEHLKNVWLPMSEIARVLRVGGHLIFSVPNLGSLHNRVMLGFGWQPSSIRTFGPHVRSFTFRQAKDFLMFGQCFAVERAVGVGFYPFSPAIGRPFAHVWPGASHTPVFVARRLAGDPRVWERWAAGERSAGQQTFYTAGASS